MQLRNRLQPVIDALVRLDMRKAKVEAVTRIRNNRRLEALGLLEHGLAKLQQVGSGAVNGAGGVTIASAEGNIAITSDDEHVAGELVGKCNGTTSGQELANGSRLAVLGTVLENVLGEVAGAVELDVDADSAGGANVAGGVLVLEAIDAADGHKVAAEGKKTDEAGCLAETGEDDAVGLVGVVVGEAVGHGGAEGVAGVVVLLELVLDAAYVAVVEALGELD